MEKEDVKAFRKSRGLNGSQLAARIGIARQTLASIERGDSKITPIVENYIVREMRLSKFISELKESLTAVIEELNSTMEIIKGEEEWDNLTGNKSD